MPDSSPDISKPFKLAAIDLDGTLLGADHAISEANAEAVRRLQAAGAQVILASGRHYTSMHKYVAALPGVQWVVSCQGGELSNADRTTVLSRRFLSGADVRKTLEAGRALGFTTVAYAVEGIFTDAPWNAEMDFYTDLAGHKPVQLAPAELLARAMFKVIWMGKPEAISRLSLAAVADTRVQAVRTNKKFLEFMPADVSKASALHTLAAHLGIAPADAVVFGDGDNDIPMFEWAGESVAMPHGWPLALKKAKLVAPAGPPETAFARAVDLVLGAGRSVPVPGTATSADPSAAEKLEAARHPDIAAPVDGRPPAACERCGNLDASEIGGQMMCAECVTLAGCGCAG